MVAVDVDVPDWNVDDLEVSKTADPRVQVGQFDPGKNKSADPVSRMMPNVCGL
jgi:hypothetical protein